MFHWLSPEYRTAPQTPRFSCFCRSRKHLPIAANGFVYLDGNRRVLVIAQGDFKFHLPQPAAEALVVRLFALADHVKGVADFHGDEFVFRRVVNVVLADKEQAAFRILLIDAHIARRKWNAQPGLFFVLELVKNHDGILQRRTGVLRIVIVEVLPVHDKKFLHRDTGALEQADLLGVLVLDGSSTTQRIKLVLAETFLLELGPCGSG